MNNCKDTGVILQMQDYSIHDGDGVRTIVFFAGCPLRCKWCANPESWTPDRKLVYYRHKCVHCGRCASVCPNGLDPTTMGRPNDICKVCGKCAEACLKKALDVACVESDAKTIIERIQKDSFFFRCTGGGVTFSGGEPFSQHQFLRTLANEFYDEGISMWVETSGYFNWDNAKDIIEKFDHVFMDVKHMDSAVHEKLTGVRNELILENAKKVHDLGIPITVRIPSIVDINMTKENITATAKYLSEKMPTATVELLPYHELGKAKYIALGMEDTFVSYETPTKEDFEWAYAIFEKYGVEVVEYR